MLITPKVSVVELFVKIILLFVVIGLLIFLLCGCGEPPFRCSKCKSRTTVVLVPRFNGKVMTHHPQPRTTWKCTDPVTHSKEETSYRETRKARQK